MLRIIAFFLLSTSLFSQPLTVVVTTPKGPTSSLDQSQRIMVTFDRPMVPLQAAPMDRSTGPLMVEPVVRGKYRWMGSTTLIFQPDSSLPYATSYTVRIPAGTKALDGSTLPEDHVWTFATPIPRVVRVEPHSGAAFVELDHTIVVEFNQPVDPASVSTMTSIEVSANGARSFPAFTAVRGDTTHRRSVRFRTSIPFPKGASVVLRLKPSLTGIEGPLPMGTEYTSSFSTYGDLRFLGVNDSARLDPRYTLTLRFSTPVSRKDVAALLSFTPPLELREDLGDYDWTSEQVSLAYEFVPERSYRGVLKAGLTDRFGNRMTEDRTFTFTTGAYEPYVTMAQGIGIIEAYEKVRYPFRSLNVASVSARMGLIDTSRIIPVMNGLRVWSRWEANDQAAEQEQLFTVTQEIPIKHTRNQQAVSVVDLMPALGERTTGIVALQINTRLKDQRYLKALFQVTHMGITSKFSPQSTLIWVTRLKDARPVPGAAVELRDDSNRVAWRGVTDQNGLASAPGWGALRIRARSEWSRPKVWAIVLHEGDVAFTNSEWAEGIEPWQFGIPYQWNPKPESYRASVFTDRGLYKAGESVGIKGIVRIEQNGDWRVTSKVPLRLTVRDPRNEVVKEVQPKLSPFGSFAIDLPLAGSATLGTYSVVLETRSTAPGQAWQFLQSGSFRIEAFRPAEFDVTLNAMQPTAIVGDSITATIGARYLFGAPMKNETAAWRISASRTDFNPPGHDGWWFGELWWLTDYTGDQVSRLFSSGSVTLDEHGGATVGRRLAVGEVRGTVSLLLESDVTSPTRQMVSGRTSVLVHGGEYYPGVAVSSTFISRDSLLTLRLLAVRPDGSHLSGQELTLRILRREWRSVRKAQTGGRYVWDSVVEDVLVDSSVVTTGREPISYAYRPNASGMYVVDVQGSDARGNRLRSQAYFYVTGPGYVPWERSNDDRIELVADKSLYRPGDVAKVLIKSPYEETTALVSIEREGILRHLTMTLRGSAPSIEVPIRPNYLPNVFVSVILLQGRVDSAARTKEADIGRPSFKAGIIQLSVSPVSRKLAVALTPDKAEYRPGDTVTVGVKVTSASGKGVRAEVALSVADLGVLNLIGYRMPDPFDWFYAPRPLAVTTTETRMHLVEQRNYDEKGEPTGGGGLMMAKMADASAEGIRKDFRPSAYWNPAIITGRNGTATVRFKLPDNLTSFRAMAVAQTTASEFGAGEASFAVNKPLLVQPAFPRFARAGDVFEGGVLIFNYATEPRAVTVRASASSVSMEGADSAEVIVPPGQAIEVRRHFRAERPGTAVFRFQATAGNDADGLQWKIPIQVRRPDPEAVALSGSVTDKPSTEAVWIPKEIDRTQGGLEVQASSTAMVGLSGGISYLFTYPYGCLEQRISSILPVILAEDLVKAFGFDVFKDRDHRQVVRTTLDEIVTYQRMDGGFAYWRSYQHTWPYVSAYAAYALVKAEQNGYTVDRGAMERAIEYLQRYLRGEIVFASYPDAAQRTTKALALYVLALRGVPDHGYMEKLYQERDGMSLFGRAYLLKALAAAKGNRAMISGLAQDLLNRAKVSPTSVSFEESAGVASPWIWDSPARTNALILQALAETQPTNALLPRAVRWLVDDQKQGRWRTTQENLYVVDALATYLRAFEREEPDFRGEVQLAGGSAISALFKGRTFTVQRRTIPMSDLQAGNVYRLEVSRQGTGRFYYEARLRYAPLAPVEPREEGLTVLKQVEVVDGSGTGDTVAAGSMVRVTLTIVTGQQRHFIAVSDPLPAGWEAVNTSFRTTAQTRRPEASVTNAIGDDDAYSDYWTWNPFSHSEQRDDRVTLFADVLPAGVHSFTYLARATSFGTFRMPATRAEGMYEPEVFGNTGERVVIVR